MIAELPRKQSFELTFVGDALLCLFINVFVCTETGWPGLEWLYVESPENIE